MNTFSFLNEMNDKIAMYVNKMRKVNATQLGLDARAGSALFVDDHCIVVHVCSNRNLRYYGGFEYIDERFCMQAGDYVFYFKESEELNGDDEDYSSRVCECLDTLHFKEKE